jgi:ribosomal protein L32
MIANHITLLTYSQRTKTREKKIDDHVTMFKGYERKAILSSKVASAVFCKKCGAASS